MENYKIRLFLLFYLVLLIPIVKTYAQPYETNPDFNRTRNWHFGYGTGLFFSIDSIFQVPSNFNTSEASSVHSDKDGNLLLYSNGEKIWNANHTVIHNGNLTLGHHSSNLGSVFVFHKDSPDSIYLFNTNFNQSTNKEFTINLIVFEEDTFRVVFKDSVILNNVCEPIAVVKAGNGRDIWIIVHEFEANNLYSYLLTEQGLLSCPIVSKSFSTPFGSPHAAFFNMVFSSDGNYVVRANTNQDFSISKRVELYRFHLEKGKLQFLYSIDSLSYFVRGLQFSKDSRSLYVVERDSGVNIFKFNPIDSLETVNSRKKIWLNGLSFSLQNMPYHYGMALSRLDTFTKMDFILNVDNSDTIEVLEKQIDLNSYTTGVTFPNFNQSYYHTPSINFNMKLNCIDNTIQFYGHDTINANNHNWEISIQGNSVLTANIKNPMIKFEDTGIYEVRYIANNGSRSDTITKIVEILPKVHKGFLGNDTGWCESLGASITLNAPIGMHCYEWNTGEASASITADTAGVYITKITTPNFCVIYDTVVVSIDTIPNMPDLYKDKDTLKTNTIASHYQWLRNNQPLGENKPYLILKDTGIYSLRIMNNGGCVSISDTMHISDTSLVGLEKIILGNIKVYPNPFNNLIFVNDVNNSIAKIEIHSIEGKVLKDIVPKDTETIIKTNEWAEGIYIICLQLNNHQVINYKLIKTGN